MKASIQTGRKRVLCSDACGGPSEAVADASQGSTTMASPAARSGEGWSTAASVGNELVLSTQSGPPGQRTAGPIAALRSTDHLPRSKSGSIAMRRPSRTWPAASRARSITSTASSCAGARPWESRHPPTARCTPRSSCSKALRRRRAAMTTISINTRPVSHPAQGARRGSRAGPGPRSARRRSHRSVLRTPRP